MSDKLTAKQEAFVLAYLATGNATESYRRAYSPKKMSDENINVEASRLLKNPKVAPRLDAVREKVAERAIVSKEWVISRLVENVNRSMQAEAVKDSEGSSTGEYRYEGSVANRALELIGKELKMFVDRKEVGQPGEFDNLTTDELRERIRRETEALGLNGREAEGLGGSGTAGSKPN